LLGGSTSDLSSYSIRYPLTLLRPEVGRDLHDPVCMHVAGTLTGLQVDLELGSLKTVVDAEELVSAAVQGYFSRDEDLLQVDFRFDLVHKSP